MTAIKATGIRDGSPMTVICVESDGILFMFNNIQDRFYGRMIREEMKKRHLIAGTFTPEENSMLNVLNVLQYYFFDEPPEIETTGEFEEMPSEDGVVY